MRRKIVMIIFQKHRAFFCYLLLSLWIFITVISLYKYLGTRDSKTLYGSTVISEKPQSIPNISSTNIWKSEKRFKKIFRSCNPVESISVGAERAVLDNFLLEGVIIIFRHGDRGPINHVRNLDSINCNQDLQGSSTILYNDYISFITSFWSNQILSNLYQFDGQQNHAPISNSKQCKLGQLTSIGVTQHLKLGSELRKVYFNTLFDNVTQIHHAVLAYTTKYRRTFQSLNAFLYGFLRQKFYKIPLYISNSMNYCFEDCACPAIDFYNRMVLNENSKRLKSHPAIAKLIEEIASIVYTMSDRTFSKDPHYMKDALLTYICHNSPLPCSASKCLHLEHVTRVFSYIDWDIRQFAKSIQRYKFSLLAAYGFLKNIISYLLKIVSNENPKFILYSAHDKTIQYVLTALGITSNDAVSPPYTSRTIFEIFGSKQMNNSSTKKFYFRILLNGKDLTNRVKFCKNENIIAISRNKSNIHLCSFESLIRFLHDNYFSIFSSANYKDACILTKS